MQDKSVDIGRHSSRSTPFCCRKSSTILARWGLTLLSWKMTFWPIWRRYGTTCGWRISSMYTQPVKLPGTTTRVVLPLLLIPAHTITLLLVGCKALSLAVAMPNSDGTVNLLQTKPAFIREKAVRPLLPNCEFPPLTTKSPGSIFNKAFSPSSESLTFAVITKHLMKDNSVLILMKLSIFANFKQGMQLVM